MIRQLVVIFSSVAWNVAMNYDMFLLLARGDYFRFGLIFIKKSNQTEFFFQKKPKPVQTDRFRFGFKDKNRFKPVWLGFFCFGSIRFGCFSYFFSVFLVF